MCIYWEIFLTWFDLSKMTMATHPESFSDRNMNVKN